ncbi:unnamed protein product [Albugo candida]|uniref:Uncharacterized protein n=1 Tax=Albugo candida TaxID=65357 RepID=A0A024G2M6_9STRA|nr:unnamed protein product [Albugo candida]|eukprot:CCI40568.1 unnamed protein product [Albugo candida]
MSASKIIRNRPHSASLGDKNHVDASRSSFRAVTIAPKSATGHKSDNNIGSTSAELMHALECKVRKIVDKKRCESDRLRYQVLKKREEVKKTKLTLDDLMAESRALGVRVNSKSDENAHASRLHVNDRPSVSEYHVKYRKYEENSTQASKHSSDLPQAIPIISRRPIYAKNTNIEYFQAQLKKSTLETWKIYRKVAVCEHIKRRLRQEWSKYQVLANQLKDQYEDKIHRVEELQRKEITTGEALSQLQSRLIQRKAEIASQVKSYKQEVLVRQKWMREKQKFENFYEAQIQTMSALNKSHAFKEKIKGKDQVQMIDSNDSLTTSDPESEDTNLAAESLDYENAFRRLDVGVYKDAVDVEEVLQILKARQDLKRELDEKHQEYLFETDKLRQSLESLRNTEREQCSLLRRNMDQILGLPEDVQSTVERRLATVIDRYVFVDQTVRPIKDGLEELLQRWTAENVDKNDLSSLESRLVQVCEDCMRVHRFMSSDDTQEPRLVDEAKMDVSTQKLQSPYNVRIEAKEKKGYISAASILSEDELEGEKGTTALFHSDTELSSGLDAGDTDELADVMDRMTLKRISNVLTCNNAIKKGPRDI